MKRALVFDSGVGGLSVLDAMIAARLPLAFDYAADNSWLPYGAKSDAALQTRVPVLLAALVAELAPDVVVMACNTASTIALEASRAALTVPIVGVVPPIKPAAALSKTGAIGLLATPATVARAYTDDLIARFASGVCVVRFGSTALVAAAEAKLAGGAPDPRAISEAIAGLFAAPGGAEIDVVALACTHFPLLRGKLEAAAPAGVTWLDSGAAIARRVADVLNLTQGEASAPQRAIFTDALAARPLAPAFAARGFTATLELRADLTFREPPVSIS